MHYTTGQSTKKKYYWTKRICRDKGLNVYFINKGLRGKLNTI